MLLTIIEIGKKTDRIWILSAVPPPGYVRSTYRGVPWKGLNCTGLYWEADSNREGTGKGMVMDCMGMGRGKGMGRGREWYWDDGRGGPKTRAAAACLYSLPFFYPVVLFC